MNYSLNAKSLNSGEADRLLFPEGAVPAPSHPQEDERLARLRDYMILDTEPEAAFNDLIRLASYVTDTPLGAISFVDREREWFKATHGFDDKQTARSIAFGAHAILEKSPAFIVTDTAQDDRFSSNPLVTGSPNIRFYAGIPMLTSDGLPLGSFSVMDRVPRELTVEQLDILRHLARITMDIVESERHAAILEKHLVIGGDLPEALSALAAARGPLHILLNQLVGLYTPLLGNVDVRVQRFRRTFPVEAFYTPQDPPNKAAQRLWEAVDRSLNATARSLRRGTIEVHGTRYLYGLVPVAFAGHPIARVDFLSAVRDGPYFANLFKLMLTGFHSMALREVRAQALRFLTDHDPLTGLGNRTPLIAELNRSIRAVDPVRPTQGLVHLCLDDLAEVNDNFGYAAGDRVLVETARRLSAIQNGENFIARISGNKFLVLLRGIETTGSLRELLEGLAARLNDPFPVDGETVRLHASIGCALIDEPTLHPVEILRRADVAMRLASEQEDRDGPAVFIYEETMFHARQQRHRSNLLVRQTYDENRFFLVFQPFIDLERGRLGGAEVLLRIRERDGRVLAASEFMEAIVRIRYQSVIDRWVFAEFLRLFRENGPARPLLAIQGFCPSLNATPALISVPGFARQWLGAMNEARLPPAKLIVELVENPLIGQNPTLIENLAELRAAGVRIAVDDFGSGYSNLRHLVKLPIDIVKLDRAFLAELDAPHRRGHVLLQSMINVCRELGYAPLVEGVETAAQDTFVRDNQPRYAQGNFYSRPLTLDELLIFVRSFPHKTSS
jgi:diguanylate cyclase (GGDEF)-like protein